MLGLQCCITPNLLLKFSAIVVIMMVIVCLYTDNAVINLRVRSAKGHGFDAG